MEKHSKKIYQREKIMKRKNSFVSILASLGKLCLYACAIGILYWIYLILLIFLDFKVWVASLLFLFSLIAGAIAWLFAPWKKGLTKIFSRSAKCIALAGVLAVVGTAGYVVYLDSIRVVNNQNINTTEYLPFDENSKIARLDGDASLKFTMFDDLPVIDCAAALFPTASAFVNATYPSNIPPLNREDSPFRYTNTPGGNRALANGEIDFMIGVEPQAFYKEMAAENGYELESVPIGKEAFVFFTNAKNPVKSLTIEQIRGIYSGEITNWKQVGGENLEIQVFMRNGNSGSASALEKLMGDLPIVAPKTEFLFDLMSGIVQAASDYENHRGAIGFSFRYYVTDIVNENSVRFIPIEGVEPTIETIASGEYPLVDQIYVSYRKGHMTEEMQRLLNWILSEEGQLLIERSGYAPIS